ncbi:Serine/threonine-protein phosphatase 6 regulatory subunit like [Actinidia chinensis var. chinensis]|uniref:Serine/threonine-protein phosphatase 6 regulatory subunit like n=1 Tax=Actinidia chinensis var. chinensis TaxID=1590841 RepID=A0A2R6RP16_ACTCC|nr:Serine/threonine-protein phosphatase 6 regulatory subunit like [Actinidia chinensis var. chinensis]
MLCNPRVEVLTPSDMISKFDGPKLEQLVEARSMCILEMSQEDEVVGEIIFHQHKLLCNVISKKCISDDLIHKVVKSLPQEIDDIGKRKWDAVLVNQYHSELRKAKKNRDGKREGTRMPWLC